MATSSGSKQNGARVKSAAYTLRRVDRALWEKVRDKADAEGRDIKWILVRLLERWVQGEMQL